MNQLIGRSRKRLFLQIALTMVMVDFCNVAAAASQKKKSDDYLPPPPMIQDTSKEKEEGYLINFNNVPIIEYIRFVGKITNLNFVFDQTELDFNVTIVSEDEISQKNIMSALVQVLRIHDLALLEQDNNLLITKNKNVHQIPTIVSNDLPGSEMTKAPIVTRVFRIKNTTPASISGIIRPLMSQDALVEASNETRQLIVTDITTNVDKIATLLVSIDAPHTPLEIESYVVKHIGPSELISLATQIVSPFAEGNPLLLVPQTETNTIFIISTPYLIERTLSVLEDLDTATKSAVGQKINNQNIFIYPILHKTGDELVQSLKQVSNELSKAQLPSTTKLTDALQSVKFIKESNSLLFVVDNDTLARVKEILNNMDVEGAPTEPATTFVVYKIQRADPKTMQEALTQMIDNLASTGAADKKMIAALKSMTYIKETNSLVFTGDPDALRKIQDLLPGFDISREAATVTNQFFIYKPIHKSGPEIEYVLQDIAKNLHDSGLADPAFLNTIDTMKWSTVTQNLTFTGDAETLAKIRGIVTNIDSGDTPTPETFIIYKIQHADPKTLQMALSQMAGNIASSGGADKRFLDTVKSMKYIKETNSLVFTGDPDSLRRIQDLLPGFDVSPEPGMLSNQFYIYRPVYRSGPEIENSLKDVARNLEEAGLADPAFLSTLNSMKWSDTTQTLTFTGDTQSLDRLQSIIKTLDTGTPARPTEVYIYKLKYASKDQIDNALDHLSGSLDLKNAQDQSLATSIQNRKWISDSGSFLFQGDTVTIGRIKEMMDIMDSPQGLAGQTPGTFYLYQLVNIQGDAIIEKLKQIEQNLSQSGLIDPALIQTIDTIKWVKDNNSLLLTGTPASIDQVKNLIASFDQPGTPSPLSPTKSAFFIYKPSHVSSQYVQESLASIAKDLQESGLIDPELLEAITTERYVPATDSILFTGTSQSLDRVKELLSRIDVAGAPGTQIQHVGNLTFLIYKIQYAAPTTLMNSLKSLVADLQKRGSVDQDLSDVISSMKFIQETNSLLFTGTDNGLKKVEPLLQKFDIPGLGPKTEVPRTVTPSSFVIYKPQYQTGEELIETLCEFEQNLLQSGVDDKDLFDSINNLKYIQKTNSLLISGDPVAIRKVQDLLQKFDVANTEGLSTTSIESIDNTSFLVYKLQYHQGEEISVALKQISNSLAQSNSNASQSLLNAINTLQWIKVTNSLLCTGEQATLSKLRELIQNLDVPLKQVFIEILVIETSMTNTQNFGLEWGGKAQYLNKVAGAAGNFPATGTSSGLASTSTPTPGGFNLGGITATRTPQGSDVPFVNGFDLGVIGDIILHKGKSFISLGALVNALEIDQDSTVVMNPKVIAQDNNNSTIFVGNNIPFVGSVVTTNQLGSTNTTSVEYRDIGVSISITPVMGEQDIVTLDIQQDISEQTGAAPILQAGNVVGIQTSHTSMTTRVHVPDNYFVVLSGMIQDTKTHYRSQIPCLGGLPVIGMAFSENDRLANKQNIIIFMRPHIIKTFDQYKQITEDQEHVFKDDAVLPVLKEEFDQGLDLVKTPQDE